MNELSDNHKRAIHSLAQMVEAKLIDLEGFFHTSQLHEPVCTSINNDLTRDEEKEIKQIMQKLYALLSNYCQNYEIKRTELSLKKEILFKTAMLWQELAGADSKSLTHSGKLDEGAKEEFETYTTQMTNLVNELYAVCNN